MGDILAVMWKEMKEIMEQFAVLRRGGFALGVLTLIFGVLMPWQVGPPWMYNQLLLFYWPFTASSMSATIIADTFAGERERRTLETLLASRLSDRAILFGKVAAAIGYGVFFVALNLAVGTVTINLIYGHGEFLFFQAPYLITLFGLVLLFVSFVSCIGLLVSLRASSAREAQQTVGIALTVIFLAPVFIYQLLPDRWREAAVEAGRAISRNPVNTLVNVVVGLITADVLLLAIAVYRFRRGRLLLD